MNRVVRATRWTMVATFVFLVVACAATPTSLPSPVPIIPTPTALVRAAPVSTLLVPSPSPRKPIVTPIITPILPSAPHPTPRPNQFDEVDSRILLSVLFPDLEFTPVDDVFRVNTDPDWTMWIGSRVEGQFTEDAPELAVIVANDAPYISTEQLQRYAPWGSFLAIFQKREGKLQVAQRALIFPTFLSPLVFDVEIEAATDFDHDGQDELLITTTSMRLGISMTAAFLYLWDGQAFVPVWSAPIADDNTGALNQSEFYSTESQVRFADVDSDGMDEIIVDSARIDYARDAQGLADIDHEIAQRSYRRLYRWGGSAFVLDPAWSTVLPALATPSP